MNYSQLIAYLENILQDQAPSTDFTEILPAAIQDAEGRIYREIDFLATRKTDSSAAFTPGNRELTLPTSIIIVQAVAAVSPAGNAPSAGARNTLEPVSLDFIDCTWPVEATTGVPKYWTLKDATTVIVAPTPAAAYKADITGIYRPAAISSSNQTTYVGGTYPDLLVAACMVFMTGYQRDYGAQADDPKMALSWEQTYQDRKKSVIEEDQRRKGQSANWANMSPAPLSNPPRS